MRIVMPSTHRCVGLMFVCGFLSFACGCSSVNGFAMNESGAGYYRAGNYAMAHEEFRRASLDAPQNPNYIYNQASCAKKIGRSAEAEKLYRQALTQDPAHQASNRGLAMLLNEQGRQKEANEQLTAWLGIQPYAAAPHVEMAWLKTQMGETAAAEQSLRTALKIQPNHPTALAQMGQIHQDRGQNRQALVLYQQSLLHKRNQPEVHARMASLIPRPMAPQTVVPQYAVAPAANQAGTAWQPTTRSVMQQPITFEAQGLNADPAHVPRMSTQPSAVRPY